MGVIESIAMFDCHVGDNITMVQIAMVQWFTQLVDGIQPGSPSTHDLPSLGNWLTRFF
jgi:hypothetical protein